MRVSHDWLNEWVSTDMEGPQLAERLTTLGLEVDGVEAAAESFSGVVVAQVIATEPHPKADRLTLCRVNAGGLDLQVVCGAANVRPGMRAALAQVGASLPGGVFIKASKLRGIESQGMLCAGRELGLGEDSDGILDLPADAPIGADLRQYLRLDDAIFDIDLTPNRGDCFSVLGIAREIAANLNTGVKDRTFAPVPASIQDAFPVSLQAPAACPRFVGRVIRGISEGVRSPPWMVERLRRAGVRSIHPVVDVTNYVMLELGQPLHGYDLGKLKGQIEVRWGSPGESLVLLDGRVVTLEADMLVIADRSGPVSLAGIMGGISTSVDADTRGVFLEAAYFSVDAVAGRARRLGLHTDASQRFERGVDPLQQARAIEYATRLLVDIAGGEPGPLMESISAADIPGSPTVRLRHARLNQVLGMELGADLVKNSLLRLHMAVSDDGRGGWDVVPPSFRFDIKIEEDLIEEVARLVGYSEIPRTPELSPQVLASSSELTVHQDEFVDILVARGYQEVITYSFVAEALQKALFPEVEPVALANPISRDMAVMRRSLWPGLLATARANIHRQQPRQRLFEVGNQFEQSADEVVETLVLAGLASGDRFPEGWDNGDATVDFFDVKGDLEALIERTGRAGKICWVEATHPALHPGKTAQILVEGKTAGWLGSLHPQLAAKLELDQPPVLFSLSLEEVLGARLPRYVRPSKFPALRRDLAVIVDENLAAQTIIDYVKAAAGPVLRDVLVFDVYRGEAIDSSRKSIALGLILQDTSRTLTDDDAEGAVGSVIMSLVDKLGATIRK